MGPIWGNLKPFKLIFQSLLQGSDPKKQKKEPGLLLKRGTVASIFNDEVLKFLSLNTFDKGYKS